MVNNRLKTIYIKETAKYDNGKLITFKGICIQSTSNRTSGQTT